MHACIGLAASVACAASASAQQHDVSPVAVQLDVWSFTPIVTQTGSATTVHSFLALKDPGSVVGANITAVWYVRDPLNPAVWNPKSWQTQDQWQIIQQIKVALAIPDSSDDRWLTIVLPPQTSTATTEPASNFAFGVLESDPLAPIVVQSQDPQPLVQYLSDIGYPAANMQSSTSSSGCTQTTTLNGMATGVEASLAADQSSAVSSSVMHAYWAATCAQQLGTPPPPPTCPPSKTYGAAGAWGAWTGVSDYASCGSSVPCTGGVICSYCRTSRRIRSRVVTITAANCAVTTCTQTQTQTGEEKHVCACQPAPCPAGPIVVPYCPTAINIAPITPTTTNSGDWLPPC